MRVTWTLPDLDEGSSDDDSVPDLWEDSSDDECFLVEEANAFQIKKSEKSTARSQGLNRFCKKTLHEVDPKKG